MSEAAPKLGPTLCPEGTHRIFTGANAAGSLRELPDGVRQSLVQMLCDVAEVAEQGGQAVDFWRDESILWLRYGSVSLLYSVDRSGGVVIHHIIASGAMPSVR